MRDPIVTVPPSEEPVSANELRAHCKVDLTSEDTILAGYNKAARIKCEQLTRRAFVTTTFRYTIDCFPYWYGTVGNYYQNAIWLPRADVIAVSSVTYVDQDGTTQTLSAGNYQVTTGHPAKIVPSFGNNWPTTRAQPDAVTVTFTAGYGNAAAVPDNVKTAIKLLAAHLYFNRSAVEVGVTATEVPFTTECLLAPELWGIS